MACVSEAPENDLRPSDGYDFQFLNKIHNDMESLSPTVIFLLGFNYHKLHEQYQNEIFLDLAKIIENGVETHSLSTFNKDQIFRELYQQNTLSQVLRLKWFKNQQEAFDKRCEALSHTKEGSLSEREVPEIIKKFMIPSFEQQSRDSQNQPDIIQDRCSKDKANHEMLGSHQDNEESDSDSSLIQFEQSPEDIKDSEGQNQARNNLNPEASPNQPSTGIALPESANMPNNKTAESKSHPSQELTKISSRHQESCDRSLNMREEAGLELIQMRLKKYQHLDLPKYRSSIKKPQSKEESKQNEQVIRAFFFKREEQMSHPAENPEHIEAHEISDSNFIGSEVDPPLQVNSQEHQNLAIEQISYKRVKTGEEQEAQIGLQLQKIELEQTLLRQPPLSEDSNYYKNDAPMKSYQQLSNENDRDYLPSFWLKFAKNREMTEQLRFEEQDKMQAKLCESPQAHSYFRKIHLKPSKISCVAPVSLKADAKPLTEESKTPPHLAPSTPPTCSLCKTPHKTSPYSLSCRHKFHLSCLESNFKFQADCKSGLIVCPEPMCFREVRESDCREVLKKGEVGMNDVREEEGGWK
ncbi:unnamed protein product [Moneuplotes crassus]|uniref:RING-type domain-containing protein n=1 Tax=Euplotes crassus TaxID=5936 RepID=A0AAD1XJD0_EUPCR|nr:unnamed protein product [Moneuplotes crassus]